MIQYAQYNTRPIRQRNITPNSTRNITDDQYKFCDRFIAFDEYIAEKYSKELSRILYDDLIEGYDGEASVKVRRRTAKVESVYNWQDGENEISGIIHYAADCKIDVDGKDDSCTCECNIWFSACIDGGRVDCDFHLFRDELNILKHTRYGDRLCRYLLPMAGTQRVEKICEGILRHYCPEVFTRNRLADPKDLASALGLKIVYMPLRGMDSKCSLLVMEDTELPTGFGHVKGNNEMTAVKRNTIVLNTNHRYCTDKAASHIAHECYHFAGQKLFNRFQMISHAEYPGLAGKHKHNYDEAEAYHWMEWQAYVGSSFIRYPGIIAREDFQEARKIFEPVSAHAGELYQNAAFFMAHKWNIPVNLAKKLLLYTKHIEAKGACNYVDGRSLRPFAFDKDKCESTENYIISLEDLLLLYVDNPKLCEAMQEGRLVYADGHICANNPAYVRKNKQGIYRLTDLAIKSVDTCCLLFRIDYYILEEVGYKVGVLSCDDRQIKYKSELADVFGCETGLIGLIMKPCEENRALPFRFGDTLRYYREAAHMTQKKLAEDLDVEERTILRIENNQTTKISLRMVLLIAFEFKMKPPNVRDLLGKARFVSDETPVGQALNLIIGMFNQLNKEMLETVADEYEAILASSTEEEAITFSLAKKQRSHMRAG